MPSSRRQLTMTLTLIGMALSLPVAAGGGLQPAASEDLWPRWQTRVLSRASFSLWRHAAQDIAEAANVRQESLSLLGDYYFSARHPSQPVASGFRATSGLIIGTPSSRALSNFEADWRAGSEAGLTSAGWGNTRAVSPSLGTVPYVGVGYTSVAPRTGWAFSADVGLLARHGGSAAKFGRVFSGAQSLDDLLREMRLAPLLNVGVSYSF